MTLLISERVLPCLFLPCLLVHLLILSSLWFKSHLSSWAVFEVFPTRNSTMRCDSSAILCTFFSTISSFSVALFRQSWLKCHIWMSISVWAKRWETELNIQCQLVCKDIVLKVCIQMTWTGISADVIDIGAAEITVFAWPHSGLEDGQPMSPSQSFSINYLPPSPILEVNHFTSCMAREEDASCLGGLHWERNIYRLVLAWSCCVDTFLSVHV